MTPWPYPTNPDDTLLDALDRAAGDTFVGGLRFVDRREAETLLNWAELRTRAARVAGGLRARGVESGDRVVLVFPTSPAFFDAFFGVLAAGAVPVPVYPPVRLGRLEEYHTRTAGLCAAVGARLILTDARVWRLLGEATRRAAPELGCLDLAGVEGAPYRCPVPADALALIQFSSGTTVDPKPVALTHRNLLANTAALMHVILRFEDPRDGVSWLPLYHDMGLIGGVLPALVRPGRLTLLPPEEFLARPALWLRALSRTRAVVSPAPNFAYALCTERIRDEELDGVDLSAWRLALNGAEPVAPETLRRFVDRFSRWGLRPEALTPVYGLAEATLAVTFSEPDRPFCTRRFDRVALAAGEVRRAEDGVELVSVGRPLLGMEVDVPGEGVGPVRVRGPSVMTAYFGRPDATAAAVQDGWLDTGDLGFFDDGELFLVGRAKDVLILRGRNHAPQEVELLVDAVPGVRTGCTAAVSHRPDGADSEVLLVFVEARELRPGLAEDVHAAILRGAGLDAEEILVLAPGTLPRTSSGKLRRQEALRRHLAGELSPPDPVTPLRLVAALATGTLAHWRRRVGR